jgi:hypothetical protein
LARDRKRIAVGLSRAALVALVSTVALAACNRTLTATAPRGSDIDPRSCDLVASPSGSDDATGTSESPVATPQRLVDLLAPGEIGCFRAGTYTFSTLTLNTPRIALAPYSDESVTLAGHIKALPGAVNSAIEGMRLNAASSPDDPSGPKIYASGFALRGNEITNDHSEICVLVTANYAGPRPEGVVIERNVIHDCGALPSTNMDHGIYLSHAIAPIVRDNWIYENADRGVQQYPDVHGAQITGNVIADNGDGVNFSGTGSEVTTGATVAGNVVVDSKLGYNAYSGGDGPDGSGNVFRNNCVHTASGGSGIETNPRSFTAHDNLIGSPEFVDPGAGDYRLEPDSSCLANYTGAMSLPEVSRSAD